jgi:hypothetical protein
MSGMKFKEIVNRLTGISVPIFGVQWDPPELEVTKARRVVSYLEDRRVLYSPNDLEVPEHCVQSVLRIREFLTAEFGDLTDDSQLASYLRSMRAACRKFLDTVSAPHSDIIYFASRGGHWASWKFYPALGEMRGVFGVYLAMISAAFGIDVENELALIIPLGDGKFVSPD